MDTFEQYTSSPLYNPWSPMSVQMMDEQSSPLRKHPSFTDLNTNSTEEFQDMVEVKNEENMSINDNSTISTLSLTRVSSLSSKVNVTLEEIERELTKQHANLPSDAKKKMAKAELKRLKHCETVRQSRIRKKSERKGLKTTNAALEKELNEALEKYKQTHNLMSFDENSWWDCTFKRFVHSIYEVRCLRREKTELQDKLMVYDALGEQFQRLGNDFQIPTTLPLSRYTKNPSRSTLQCGTIHFEPLADAEARRIMLDSHAQAMTFFETMRAQFSTEEGTNCIVHVEQDNGQTNHGEMMGWKQYQRITSSGRVQFNFIKRLNSISVEDLVEKSWKMYCDMELYRGIYSSVTKLEILQRINDNTLLIRRDLQESTSSPIFRCIFLLFRVKLDNGYLICFRSHNPAVYVDDDEDPNVQWMEMFYWLMITTCCNDGSGRTDQQGCEVSFGGNLLDHASAQHAMVWKYQIALALLRWECNAVAPMFALMG